MNVSAQKTTHKIGGSTQKFTEIRDIIEDVVLFTNGSACLIVEIQSVNFALLSREEQDARIFSYAALLNSLSFPIQIVIRNKMIDISAYVKLLELEEEKANATANTASGAKESQRLKKLAQFINQYKNFVQELVKVNSVLDKNFYVVLSYSYLERGVAGATEMMKNTSSGKEEFFQSAKESLRAKASSLHTQLQRLNLRAKTLQKEELVKLFYSIYNEGVVEPTEVEASAKTFIVKTKKEL